MQYDAYTMFSYITLLAIEEKCSPNKSKPGTALNMNSIKDMYLRMPPNSKYRQAVRRNNDIEQNKKVLPLKYFSIKLCFEDTMPKIKRGK